MIEFEKKILLGAGEFLSIILWNSQYLDKTFCQTNYYYDTENLDMNKQGITCRIREIDGKYTATVKNHNTNIEDCSFEEKRTVANELDDSFFAGLDVKLQGSLKTERTVICCEDGLKVMLDKNTYLDVEDYEVEIEYSSEKIVRAYEMLSSIANILNNVYKDFDFIEFYSRAKNSKSKSKRFFERKKYIENQKEGNNLWTLF